VSPGVPSRDRSWLRSGRHGAMSFFLGAPVLWRSLDVLSRLSLAGAGSGPPKFGPEAIAALQAPPRLAGIDLPPPAVAEITQAIAGEWRARFASLLEERPMSSVHLRCQIGGCGLGLSIGDPRSPLVWAGTRSAMGVCCRTAGGIRQGR